MALILLNREERRYLDKVMRSEVEEAWYEVDVDENVDFLADHIVELGVGCKGRASTVEIGYIGLVTLERATGSAHVPGTERAGYAFQDHMWRWAPARNGWYPEVRTCPRCEYVHVPVLTHEAIVAILAAGREKGRLPL